MSTEAVRMVAITDISADPANLRLHDERSIESIKGSLKRFGQQKPIVIDTRGVVVAGNGTFLAAKALGWSHLLTIRSELSGVERVAYAIADNRTAELSEWDRNALHRTAKELDAELLSVTGWTLDDLDQMPLGKQEYLDSAGITDPDDVPQQPDAATTKPGDIWVLGNHRLMCGDSSSPEDLDRLLDGQKIHLVNTDPPYNVKVEPRSNNAIVAGLSSFAIPDQADQQD